MTMFIKPRPTGKVEALPAWAQGYIAGLSRLVDEQQKKLGEGPADSDTFLEPYDQNTPLGKGVTVRFVAAGERYVDVRVAAPREGQGIEIFGSRGLILHPRTNHMFVEDDR